ncbi:MAG: ATP-dependent helicase, partial [Phycisphaerae bacterium]
MIDSQSLLQDLTEPQAAAVQHVDGPLLIIAGAGSGKTRVLTRRVANLVAQGIPAPSILAITFTNKAAGEMKQRIEALMGRQIYDFGKLDQRWPTICTFHSLCLRILRYYAPAVGLPPNFSIYDSGDQQKLIKDAIKTLDLSTTNFPASAVHGTISNAKNQLLSPEGYLQNARDFYTKTVARIYGKYQTLLATNNALDFDDLILRTAQAFRDKPDVLAELQERFQYILIDEYQDTNHAQYVLAHALAQKHKNICVVGDPDQSIYAWRGADIRNILEFESDYPDATVVRLEQNYRSSKRILAIASSLIAHNKRRKEKALWTENDQGEKAKLFLCGDEHDEAGAVVEELMTLKQNFQWSDMAIFYRMNSLSRVMEDALRRQNIPYRMARGVEFYNRKEIKDVLAYLRVIANPADVVSLDRIANVPARGLSDATITALTNFGTFSGTNLWGALCEAAKIPGLTPRAVKSARGFVDLVIGWRKLADADLDEPQQGGDMF